MNLTSVQVQISWHDGIAASAQNPVICNKNSNLRHGNVLLPEEWYGFSRCWSVSPLTVGKTHQRSCKEWNNRITILWTSPIYFSLELELPPPLILLQEQSGELQKLKPKNPTYWNEYNLADQKPVNKQRRNG